MAKYTAKIIRTNGTIEQTYPRNLKYFTLEELQTIVGGHIEIVALSTGQMMTLNEEGKLLNLPFNPIATGMFNKGGRIFFDPIAGDVLVCDLDQLEPDEPGEYEAQEVGGGEY